MRGDTGTASRDGVLLIIGRFVTMLGTGMAPICLAAAGLASRSIGAGGLGFAIGGLAVGELGFTLVGGAIADRAGARRAMISGDVLAFAAQTSVAMLFATRQATTLSVTALTFILGIGAALSNPAAIALIRQICREDQLASVNGRVRTAGVLARVVGAPVGGLVAAAGSPANGLFVDAVTFLCSAVLLGFVSSGRSIGGSRWRPSGTIGDIRAGWTSFRAISWLRPTAIAAAVVNAARAVGSVLIPATLVLHGYGPRVWGSIFGIQMLGNVLAVWMVAKRKMPHALAVSFVGLTLVGIYFVVVAIGAPLAVIALLAFLAGGSISNFGMRVDLTIQRTVPDEAMSRVVAVTSSFSLALVPVSTATLAVLVDTLGRSGALALWGVAAIVAVLLAVLARSGVSSAEAPTSMPEMAASD
jgi:MFS family permease